MENQRLDLGRVDNLHVESFGEPGQRTFRILAERAGGEVSLWIEKYQVVMLGNAIEELLDRTVHPEDRSEGDAAVTFLGQLEARVGTLAIAFDGEHNLYVIEASEFETAFDLQTISIKADRAQFQSIRVEIETIVAGSRPRCVLCGAPLTGGPHFCPEQNGHAKMKSDDAR